MPAPATTPPAAPTPAPTPDPAKMTKAELVQALADARKALERERATTEIERQTVRFELNASRKLREQIQAARVEVAQGKATIEFLRAQVAWWEKKGAELIKTLETKGLTWAAMALVAGLGAAVWLAAAWAKPGIGA